MRLHENIDFTTLTWVKPELDETLRQARQALQAFVEEGEDPAQLRACTTYLHQVQGTLRMVELYGAAMVAEEMEQLSQALVNGKVGDRDPAYAALMRGIVQLPDYLERLQSGHRDIPIVLLPLLNELRECRGEKGLSEVVLFSPDLSRPLPATAKGPPEALPADELKRRADTLRNLFQSALLRWLKDDNSPGTVRDLTDVCEQLVPITSSESARRLFWVAAGTLDALSRHSFEATRPLKQALAKVEREIKRLAEGGEASFRADPPLELTRQLLYFVAHAPTDSGRIGEIREVFGLGDYVPSESELAHARGSLSGRNRALLATVAGAIKEDLMRVKDALDLHLRTPEAPAAELGAQVEALDRVADTLGMLGLGVPRRVVLDQRTAINNIVCGQRASDESALLDIAGALLYVEASLDDQVARLGEDTPEESAASNEPGTAQPLGLPSSEARKVLEVIVKEAIANFAQARQCFVAFVETHWDHAQLADVPRLMEEVSGALRILELVDAPQFLLAVRAFTENELLRRHRVPNGQQMDRLADALASLEYYLEAIRDRRPNREQILDVARESLESLGYWPLPSADDGAAQPTRTFADLPSVPPVAPAPPIIAEVEPVAPVLVEVAAEPAIEPLAVTPSVEAVAEPAPLPTPEPEPMPMPVVAAPVPVVSASAIPVEAGSVSVSLPVVPGFDGDNADIDDEIREVFLEEFEEEIANLDQLLPPWRAAPGNAELLRPIRRVFHTLKGSGRLVGAKTLGEFSYKIENMLNRVLDGSRPASFAVVGLIEQAFDTLPLLHAALKGEVVRADLTGVEVVAERVAAGEDIVYRPPADELAAVAMEADDSAEPDLGMPVEAIAPPIEDALPEVIEVVEAVAESVSESDTSLEPNDGVQFIIDPVLFEILKPEVAGHLESVTAWLGECAARGPQPVIDPVLRAVHTMNGAFAMTEVVALTEVTAPLEGFIKRSLVHQVTPQVDGVQAVRDAVAAIERVMVALERPGPLPNFSALAERIMALRDALPDARAPLVSAPVEEPVSVMPQAVSLGAPDLSGLPVFPPEPALVEPPVDALEIEVPAVEIEMAEPEAAASIDEPIAEELVVEAPVAELPDVEELVVEEPVAEELVINEPVAEEPAMEAPVLEEFVLEEPVQEEPALEMPVVDESVMEAAVIEMSAAEMPDFVPPDQPVIDDEPVLDEPLVLMTADEPERELLSLDAFIEAPATEAAASDDMAGFSLTGIDEAPLVLVDDEPMDSVEASAEPPAVDVAEPVLEAPAQMATVTEAEALDALIGAFAQEPEQPRAELATEMVGPAEAAEDEFYGLSLEQLEALTAPDEQAAEAAAAEAAAAEAAAAEAAAAEAAAAEVAAAEAAAAEAAVAEAAAKVAVAVPVAALEPVPELLGADPDDPDSALDVSDLDVELLDIFLEESTDLLDHSDGLLAKLRDDASDRELVVSLQRDLHTLKGGARMAGIYAVGELGHTMESLLEAVAEGRRDIDATGLQILERAFDRLHRMVGRVGERRAIALPVQLIAHLDALAKGVPLAALAAAGPGAATPVLAASDVSTPVPAAPVFHATLPSKSAALGALSAPIELAADDDDTSVRAPQEQVRIRADLLDRLVNYAGEVAIYRSRLEQQVGSFRANLSELGQTTARLREQLRKLDIETEAQIMARYQREGEAGDETFDPLELDRFTTQQQLSRSLAESAADLTSLQGTLEDLTRQYETLLLQQSRVSSDLQEGLMRTRMLPFDALVPRLRRVLRQSGTEVGKQVQLKVDGAAGEMDRSVLDRMTAPLEHMLRNSVAHGLETPDERRAAGKPEEGTVRIAVQREGSEVVLRISDDGRGLNRDAIRRKGIERGLIAAQDELSDQALYALILESGFSTAETVSRLAGRGVGMDVVYSEIRQLGGTLIIDSTPGKGSQFTIRLPFTLAVTQAVFVKIGDTSFAVPIASVQGVGRISREEYAKQRASEHPTYVYAGENYAIHDLGELIGHASAKAPDSLQMPLLLARSGDLRVAISIDQMLGSKEIVVKPVGPQVSSIPGIFGATVMGDGRVVVILDVAPLVRRQAALAREHGPIVPVAEVVPARRIPAVMVVDDSITMRKVTGRVLERHSMEVLTAKDGVDAIEKMAERVPDLMLLDIEMPRMDGYELAQNMKSDPRLRNVPIIMITSRTGEKHRQRAMDIGVNGYLGKPYQEAELMRNVYEILGLEPVNG